MYDRQGCGFVYDVYGIEGMAETEEKISAKKDLMRALLSDERCEYDPIREDECFKNIIYKLSQ